MTMMKIFNKLSFFQHDDFLTDAVLVSKSSTEYKVHSVLMAAASTLFEEAFRSSSISGLRYIDLRDINDDTMIALLESIYSGRMCLPTLESLRLNNVELTDEELQFKLAEIKTGLNDLGLKNDSFDCFKKKADTNKDKLDEIVENNTSSMPYSSKIIDNTLLCKYCNIQFDVQHDFNTHSCLSSKDVSSSTKSKIRFTKIVKKAVLGKTSIINHDHSPIMNSTRPLIIQPDCTTIIKQVDTSSNKVEPSIIIKPDYSSIINPEHPTITNSNPASINSPKTPSLIKLDPKRIKKTENASTIKLERSIIIDLNHDLNMKEMTVCELCGLRLKKSSMRSHFETMHEKNDQKYKCSDCNKVFHTSHRRYMHVVKLHNKVPQGHLCEICGKNFDNDTSIYYHMYKHKKEEDKEKTENEIKSKRRLILKCEFCDLRLPKSSALRAHVNSMHSDIAGKLDLPYKCTYCNKEFDYRSQFVTHVAIHRPERNFICPTCGKGFKNRVGLHYHLRIHSSVTRFVCKECGQGFKLSHHLKQHMLHHTTEKPFVCDICQKAYKAKSDLRNHLKHYHNLDSANNFIEISRDLKLLDYISESDMLRDNLLDERYDGM